MSKKLEIVPGEKRGSLTVVEQAPRPSGRNGTHVLCECDCGNTVVVSLHLLRRGTRNSCGCKNRVKKHGCANKTVEYQIWKAIKQRCTNPNNIGWKNYGARGITMCEEWRNDFTKFLEYLGERPSPKHTVDRINTDLGYEPGNVRWATYREQMNNKRDTRYLECNGVRKPMMEWSRELNISCKTIRGRIKRGWPIEQVLSKTVDNKKLFFIVNGQVMSTKEIADMWGVSYEKHRHSLLRKIRNDYNWHEFTRTEVKINETRINF